MSDATDNALHALAHEVALDLASQPALFPAESLPGAELLPPAVLHRRPSGKILAQDPDRCMMVGALRELGLSDRRISALTGVSREAIGPILERLEAAGKVRPLKTRLAAALGLLAEESTQAAREMVQALRDGDRTEGVTMAIRALGPMVGIASEKVQLLTGSPTEILETRAGAPSDEAAWLAAIRAEAERRTIDVTPATADSESAGQPRNPLRDSAPALGDTAGDTSRPGQLGSGDQVPASTLGQTRGGGSTAGATPAEVDGSRGCEISASGADAPKPQHQ